jgi:hypothetical protein
MSDIHMHQNIGQRKDAAQPEGLVEHEYDSIN